MTLSMTGYGKSVCQFKGRAITIEIRSLNSKQGDINVRTPAIYREKELEIRDMLSVALQRGKIDLTIQRDLGEDDLNSSVNEALIMAYYKQIKAIEAKLGERPAENAADYLSLIFKMPEVVKPVGESLEDGEYEVVENGLKLCIERLQAFRAQEGEKLAKVLRDGVEKIERALAMVANFEQERMDRIRLRITSNLGDDQEGIGFDKDRFEQELIYYLEKLDITEEKVRLTAHCEYFIKTMDEEQFVGKKLSFIAQEMGREINTLGSKAQHAEMQRLVVGMKDELEKIKEQVLNVL